MYREYLFALITRLLGTRWIRDCRQYHTAAEVAYTGRLGPGCTGVEINNCFVLDHCDAYLAIHLGPVQFGYRVCLGEETVRSSGFYWRYER
jgi:hypothetical protein